MLAFFTFQIDLVCHSSSTTIIVHSYTIVIKNLNFPSFLFLKIFYFQLYLLQSEKIMTFFCNTNFNQNNTIQEHDLTSYNTTLQSRVTSTCKIINQKKKKNHRLANTQNTIFYYIIESRSLNPTFIERVNGNKPAQTTKATNSADTFLWYHIISRLAWLLHGPVIFGIAHLYQNVPSEATHGWEVLHPVSAAEHDDSLCNGRLHKQASPPKHY